MVVPKSVLVGQIEDVIEKKGGAYLESFRLFDLYEGNYITFEDALRNADSVNDLRLQIKLNSARARNTDLGAGTEHLKIV